MISEISGLFKRNSIDAKTLKMTLTKAQIDEIVSDEVSRWKLIHSAVVENAGITEGNLGRDRKLARELTSELVGSQNVEDKVQLASDEAVAHGLSKLRELSPKRATNALNFFSALQVFLSIASLTGERLRSVSSTTTTNRATSLMS